MKLIQEKQKCDELGLTILRNGKLINETIILGDLKTKSLCGQNYTRVAEDKAAEDKYKIPSSKLNCRPKFASGVDDAKKYNWDITT